MNWNAHRAYLRDVSSDASYVEPSSVLDNLWVQLLDSGVNAGNPRTVVNQLLL